MVVMAVFTGAYMAESIRGALQALPRGQYEAAHAVGLTRLQALRLIILPQALRISIRRSSDRRSRSGKTPRWSR